MAAVLFDEKYDIERAALIPKDIVLERSSFVEQTNSYKFILADNVWEEKKVTDVTGKLRGIVTRLRDNREF